MLTTRGYILSRHLRMDLKRGISFYYHQCANVLTQVPGRKKKIPGLRRYKTEKRAKAKAERLNKYFKTTGYSAIREDQI